MKLRKNISTEDRIIRFVLFDLLLGMSLSGMQVSALVANLVFGLGIYILITLIFGYSPLYHLLGISSIPKATSSN